MRSLTQKEITALEAQQCICDNWNQVRVADDFSPEYIRHVRFSGNISLGTFNKTFDLPSGIQKHSGIFYATLHNCIIEDDVYISNINNHIANYIIKDDCYIENVNMLSTEGSSSFGNGTVVNVLNEAGGRDVKIFNELSSHLAYMLTLYRHRPDFIKQTNLLIDDYTASRTSTMGIVNVGSSVTNCGSIINVMVGEYATLSNVTELFNGTINSSGENPSYVGANVIARHFIAGQGSKIYDGALLERCFVGESCEVAKLFSATDSLFFCNSQVFHGEATAIFAGPFTTTHHKPTLLIGCMFSFYNAGSGTNQSNHMYKLGPVHQGIFERGVKTGSDTYIMLEARAGAFSLIMGHHDSHFDTSDLPFSYILEGEGKSMLIPAANFQTVGTQRDYRKWPKRDTRKGSKVTDYIIFDLLNPYIVRKIKDAINVLTRLNEKPADTYNYKNVRIKSLFAVKGIKIYQLAINYYIGYKLTERQDSGKDIFSSESTFESYDWVDLSGLIIPKKLVEDFMLKVESGKVLDIDSFDLFFKKFFENYADYEWNFVLQLLAGQLNKPIAQLQEDDVTSFMQTYKKDRTSMIDAIVADARKEFTPTSMISFGADGDKETQLSDFENVRGTCDTNEFVYELTKNKKE